MKRSVSSQNFCRLSEQHASPEDLDKQGAVLQKLLSWVYWLYVFQSNCQLLPSVFISFFIFYFTIFRHPPKPSHAAWPSNFRPRAMERSAQESWDGAGHTSSVHAWQLSDPLLRFTNGFLPQMPACLESRGTPQPPLQKLRWETDKLVLTNSNVLTRSVSSYFTCKHHNFLICKMRIMPTVQNPLED